MAVLAPVLRQQREMSLKTSVKMRLAGLAATAVILSSGTALSADLVISNWAGYMAPDIAETFKAATGLTIEVCQPRHQ